MQDSLKKILIVADNPEMLQSIARRLRSIGYGVITASDASEAISAVRHDQPDLIILDVVFPPDVSHGGGVFSDGFLLLNWLKRMKEASSIPIVMINGDDSAEQIERARAAGASAFFPKPINFDGLVVLIARKLGEPVLSA